MTIISVVAWLTVLIPQTLLAISNSGYKIKILSERIVPVELNLKSADIMCSKIDFWGQSELVLVVKNLKFETAFPVTQVLRLYDGPCISDQTLLQNEFAGKKVKAGISIKLIEYKSWGIISEGSDRERTFCHLELKQFAYLTTHKLFGQFDYQTSDSKKIADLNYNDCMESDSEI